MPLWTTFNEAQILITQFIFSAAFYFCLLFSRIFGKGLEYKISHMEIVE